MANTIFNQKLESNYPGRFNKRENRGQTHNFSLLEADSDYSFQTDDGLNFVRSTGANAFTFPEVKPNEGRVFTMYQVDAATMTLTQNADGATIESPGTIDAAGEWATFYSDGTQWKVVAKNVA